MYRQIPEPWERSNALSVGVGTHLSLSEWVFDVPSAHVKAATRAAPLKNRDAVHHYLAGRPLRWAHRISCMADIIKGLLRHGFIPQTLL